MNKEEFLTNCHNIIIDVDFSDSLDNKGNKEVLAIIDIDISSNDSSLALTKDELKFLISEIEKEEEYIKEHGNPSYIDEDI